MKAKRVLRSTIGFLFVMGFLVGCDDDHKGTSHHPPEGQGAVIVRNNTHHKLRVFFDGARQEPVEENRTRDYDREPGVYRMFLEQAGTDMYFKRHVDVLEGENTIVDVAEGCCELLDVFVFVD